MMNDDKKESQAKFNQLFYFVFQFLISTVPSKGEFRNVIDA